MHSNEVYAFILTMIAGMATAVGSLVAFFTKKTNTKLLAASLGFSAGVMIYVAMAELYIKSREYLINAYDANFGGAIWVISFFAGILLIALIDYFVPSTEGDIGNLNDKEKNESLRKMGVLMAVAMAVHNFPEGLVTFTSSLKDARVGIMIALAIAIHNIPEGITTSLPIFFATGNRRKAFVISFLSGITEPLGAIVGYTIMRPFMSDSLIGILYGVISGIMIFIAIEELLPMAREYEKSKITILSVVVGMLVMAVSILLL